uniref:BED-type domain-containing protein n=1 Tax=Leptobrachium leishanense TaxID=445787 RepID=A0A8C5PDV0_9ANUR
MSERTKRTGRRSKPQIRGQAAPVSGGCVSGRGGRGASSAGACLSFITGAGRLKQQQQHTEDLVDWLTRPSSSSESSASQASSALQSTSAATSNAASMSTATPAVASLSHTEESAEVFDYNESDMLLEDAQQVQCSDSISEVEQGSIINLEEGGASDDTQITGTHVAPAAAAYCQVGSSDEEIGGEDDIDDDEVTDSTWVPDRTEESSEEEGEEEEAQQSRGTTSSVTNRRTSQSKASHVRAAPVQSTVVSKNTCRNSAVWEFFKKCAADPTVAICNLCQRRLKRGINTGHLGTTCLRRHMNKCHTSHWGKTLHRSSSSSSVSTHTVCPAMQLPTTSTDRDDAAVMDVPAGPSSQCDIIPVAEDLRSQITLPQLLQHKKKYSPNHPQAQHLNASLAKLLALQLLPFQLVDSAPFREFAECTVPQWQVPKRHCFSRKAIPALYQHVEDNVMQSLGKAVSSKVHVTLDMWSSKHGQGRYISFTAHWVTLIAAGRDPRRGSVLELVHPPRLQNAACMRSVCSTTTTTTSSSSSSSSSSFFVSGKVAVKPTPDRVYAMAQAKRCHTVLELVCLGDRSHTGSEILSALQGQVQRWLTPRQLELGMIVCDNGSNLLSALRKGKLTHVPCLAHVLNLVVQRFLTKYPGLPELLIQARKVCSHFRRSFPASVRLAEIQREFHLPTNRLICHMPTRWNSTLAMLQRLHKQQRAINEYLCEYGTRTGSGQLVFFSPLQWLMIKDACTVLSPFEEATRMVSRDSACISDTIPLVFLLEHTLRGIIDVALEAEQREEEEAFPSSQGPSLSADSIPAGPTQIRQEEEDYLSSGGIEGGDS